MSCVQISQSDVHADSVRLIKAHNPEGIRGISDRLRGELRIIDCGIRETEKSPNNWIKQTNESAGFLIRTIRHFLVDLCC